MRHECRDADNRDAWIELVADGVVEYDDNYDAYVWNRFSKAEPLWRKLGRKIGRWSAFYLTKKVSCMDLMSHCPYCGEKINYIADVPGEGEKA